MRTGVDVDEPCAERRRDGQLVAQEVDRLQVEGIVRAGQIDEVGRVDGDRAEPKVREPGPVGTKFAWRQGPPAPGRGVVAEDLEGVEADRLGPLDRCHHPATERQVGAEPTAVGKHAMHRSG